MRVCARRAQGDDSVPFGWVLWYKTSTCMTTPKGRPAGGRHWSPTVCPHALESSPNSLRQYGFIEVPPSRSFFTWRAYTRSNGLGIEPMTSLFGMSDTLPLYRLPMPAFKRLFVLSRDVGLALGAVRMSKSESSRHYLCSIPC